MAIQWQLLLWGIGALIATFGLLSFKLGSIVGLDDTEFALRTMINQDNLALLDIIRHATMLPYKLALWVLQFLPLHGAGSIRAIGAVAAIMGIVGMHYLLRQWHSKRIAMLGTILFATSPWLLHVSRYASATALYSAGVGVFALWAWTQSAHRIRTSLLLLCLACGFALYIPGFIWFVLPALFLQRHNVVLALRRVSLSYGLVLLFVTLLLIVPLILSIAWPLAGISRLQILYDLSGIPTNLPSVQQFLHNILGAWSSIFVASDGNPIYFVGNLPFVSIFCSIMFAVGAIVFCTMYKLGRARVLGILLLGGTVLIGLDGSVPLAFLLPFIYLIIAEGIHRLLHEWMRVFPRNPIARSTGMALVSLAVLGTIWYQLTSYFIAWPHTDNVKATFTHTAQK